MFLDFDNHNYDANKHENTILTTTIRVNWLSTCTHTLCHDHHRCYYRSSNKEENDVVRALQCIDFPK